MKRILYFIILIQLSNVQLAREKSQANFAANDFVFNLAGKNSDSKGKGGTLRLLTTTQWPSLFNEGVSFTLLSLEPCSINLHNIHQYATEIIYVIDAEKLQVSSVLNFLLKTNHLSLIILK
jgi:hypothetical protein